MGRIIRAGGRVAVEISPPAFRADVDAEALARLSDQLLARPEFVRWRARTYRLARKQPERLALELQRASVALEGHFSPGQLDGLVRSPGTVERAPAYWAEERGAVTRRRSECSRTIAVAAGALARRLEETPAAADDLAGAEHGVSASAARGARLALRKRQLPRPPA